MKFPHQDNTFLSGLRPGCLVQLCLAIYKTRGTKENTNIKAQEGLSCSPLTLKTTITFAPPPWWGNLIEISNDSTFPVFEGQVAHAVDWLDSAQGYSHKRLGFGWFMCVHMSECVLGSHSRKPSIIRLSGRAVGRNWRREPQLSGGLAGGPQRLIAFFYSHRHTNTQSTPRHPHDPFDTPRDECTRRHVYSKKTYRQK